ncbi:MAG: Tfp pilus assembly protein tip-associated adhesin PilY1 [Proteobacteria bacterium]|nr:Tfp pilus assembly protein tip-associated adhesin PilY1 [Pseudomonadota bacterium]
MNNTFPRPKRSQRIIAGTLIAAMLLPGAPLAATTDLANIPLAQATTTTAILPNIHFIIDTSGSMDWDYMPDYLPNGYCKGSNATGTNYRCCRTAEGGSISSNVCLSNENPTTTDYRGMTPYYAAFFNRIYYNPEITYTPPKNHDGTSKTDYSGTGSTPLDGYNKQSTQSIDLTSQYWDVEWCTSTAYTDCLRTDNYLLPGTVDGKTYTTMHKTTASGSAKFAQGTVAAPTSSASRNIGPYYYVVAPGEYCTDYNLNKCTPATAPVTIGADIYSIPATLRWCNNAALDQGTLFDKCRATQDGTFNYPRYPTIVTAVGTGETAAKGTLTVANMPRSTGARPTGTGAACNGQGANVIADVTSITVNGVEILTAPFTYCNGNATQSTRNNGLAAEIQSRIGNGFSATRASATITVTAPNSSYNGQTAVRNISDFTLNATSFTGGIAPTPAQAVPGSFKRIDIVSGQTYGNLVINGQTVINRAKRTDCAAAPNCTYEEELSNFANWFAWYRSRMQMMKTGLSLSFVDVRGVPNPADPTDANYLHARVGFSGHAYTGTADGTLFRKIDNFEGTQKQVFFDRIFAINPSGGTPLRSALTKAGEIFKGSYPAVDPMQYSCQRNFTILSTDGYWNGDETFALADQDGIASGATAAARTNWVGWLGKKVDDSGNLLNVTRPSLDAVKEPNSLSDIAYKYYHQDLRNTGGVCTSPLTGKDVCADNLSKAGTDNDVDDVATYQHMTTFSIGLGIDGTLLYQDGYKSATSGDYDQIKQGSKNWPKPVHDSPTAIDDLWHAAVNGRGTYFSARDPVSLIKGLKAALGSMQGASGAGASAATSNLQPTAGDNFIYVANYRTVNWDGELSGYTIDLTTGAISETPTWQAASKLQQKVASDGLSDARTIHTWSASDANKLKPFTWASLTASEKAHFDNSKLAQYTTDWSADDQSFASGETMLNYLRGQDRYEDQDRSAGYGIYRRLYRDREKILGDIIHSQPVYVRGPYYDYLDTGYALFKDDKSTRLPTVYVAANDGMLHAFDAVTGDERWAYVPPTALPAMHKLADKFYASNHRYYLDGPVAVSDIYVGGVWKTILVGALGAGGRGYYALDITDPQTPKALWNYTAEENPNVGYSFGTPMITKLSDGTWSVLLTSGYNNVPEGGNYASADGKGRVFVLNAGTGALIREINTNVGSTGAPAGLATMNIMVSDFQRDNTATKAYGGDLLGNMWRFNINDGSFSKVISLGSNQPIMVAPEIGEISGNTVLYFGTGRYLGQTDLAISHTQSFYAVKDDGTSTVDTALMTKQTMANTSERTVTGSTVDWVNGFGWYLDMPASKERVHLSAQLYFGTLLFASVIPESNDCQPGGYGFIYILDAKNGMRVVSASSNAIEFTSPVVGITVARLPGGTVKLYGITADGGHPKGNPPTLDIAPAGSGSGESGWRVMWRELSN